jgi:Htaa
MNRPRAAVAAAGALLGLLSPIGPFGPLGQGTAAAEDAADPTHAVSGGYASWALTPTSPAVPGGVSVMPGAPAVRGSGDRSWFPVGGGSVDPGAGDAVVDFDGTVRLGLPGGGAGELTLSDLRLRLEDGAGTLYARYARAKSAGQPGALALAAVREGATPPTVRGGGVTWSGLRVSLTREGAGLLTDWSGRPYEQGDELAPLDVTVGTGTDDAPEAERPTPSTPSSPSAPSTPHTSGTPSLSATAVHPSLVAGGEQRVMGEGFAPGEVVLVAIDDDTRYQATADASGRVARAFPVYANAAEGTHTVELYAVTGGRRAAAEFTVRALERPSSPS